MSSRSRRTGIAASAEEDHCAVLLDFTSYWVYVAGPLVGAALAVGAAWVLRGAGGGRAGSGAAQGDIQTEVEHPDKP